MTEVSFFDDLEGGAPCPEGAGESPAQRFSWTEISQDVFMSWSGARQLAYCAKRDEDTAQHAEDVADKRFFTERAAWYRNRIQEINNDQSGV